MSGDRNAEVRRLFAEAMERAPEEREDWLEAACEDVEIRREVAALLAALDAGGPEIEAALGGLPGLHDLVEGDHDPSPQGIPADGIDETEDADHSGDEMVGQVIGRYRILERVGRGGMGVVYKARDQSLGRPVAIKFLPPESLADREPRKRFSHEARAASGLDHPTICTVHEIGETPDGRPYIVMEFVEGETLRDRIRRRPLPLDEALDIARQLCDGLARAHERGIVHRDVKPANVMITGSGQVKLLDFGLAKQIDVSLTRPGMMLGTVTTMSPEQLRGEAVDRRTDIWAVGVLLYEMITGRPPFRGERLEAVAHAVLHENPEPPTALRSRLPPKLDEVVLKAMAKDPDARYQHIDELPVDLGSLDASTSRFGRTSPRRPAAWRSIGRSRRLPALVVAGLLFVLTGWTVWRLLQASDESPPPVSFNIPLATGLELSSWWHPLAISPDGRRIAFSGRDPSGQRIYLRDLDKLATTIVPGTDGGSDPFFSPDGRWLGFLAEGALRRVEISGGIPQVVCDVPQGVRGASWGPDGSIVFTAGITSGLMRVPSEGGTPEPMTTPDTEAGEVGHLLPQHLPNGRDLLFSIWSSDGWRTAVFSPETGEWNVVLQGGAAARYAPTGHLVFAQMSAALARPGLLAVPFDLERLEVTGPPVSVVEDPGIAGPNFAFSEGGTLVYVAGGSPAWAGLDENSLVWGDLDGHVAPALEHPGYFDTPRLSPDGKRIAVANFSRSGTYDIWVYDLVRGTGVRLSVRGSINNYPIWKPDGNRLTFNSTRKPAGIYSKAVDGTGPARLLVKRRLHPQVPGSWTPDGHTLAYTEFDANGRGDIWLYDDADGPGALMATPASETAPRFSPDGRWLAFVSDVSGRSEVYVRDASSAGAIVPVSTDGGAEPAWASDGTALYYREGGSLLRVAMLDGGRIVGRPDPVLEGHFARNSLGQANYDVTADGRFVLVRETPATTPTFLTVVVNWFPQLEERAAAAPR